MTAGGTARGRATPDRPPLGIKLLAALGLVLGGFGAFAGLGVLGGVNVLLGLFLLGVAVGQVVLSVGLWNLRPWAYTWTLLLYGLSMLLDVVEMLLGDAGALFSLVLSLLIVAYVVSKSHLFRRR